VPDLKALFGRVKARLTSGSFMANVAVLAGGTAFAQGLAVLLSPVLTRLYSPDDFGIMTVYAALLAMVTIVASLSYQLAIPLPEEDQTAANALALALLLTLGTSGLLLVAVLLWGPQVAHLVNAPGLAPYLWLLPVGLVLSGVYQALNYWAVRKKAFARITRTRVNQSLSGAVSQVLLGLLQIKPLGLLVGTAIGQGTGSGTLAALAWRHDREALCGITWSGIRQAAVRHKSLVIYMMPTAVMNTLSVQLPVYLLGYFFSATIVGYWGLSQRVLTLPMSVVGVAVGQVFLQQATEAHRSGQLAALATEVFGRLLNWGLTPILLLTIVGPAVFGTVFGARWVQSGVYVQWLGLWTLFVFLSSPLSMVFTVLGRLRAYAWYNLVMLVVRFASLYLGGIYHKDLLAVGLFGATGALMWAALCLWILWEAGVALRIGLRLMGVEMLRSLPFILPVLLVVWLLRDPRAVTICTAVSMVAFVAYAGRRMSKGHGRDEGSPGPGVPEPSV
jgi:O-antigen/teichoic acid export membrane protein